jgi:putative solute:sodium symporter small subunit
MDHYKKELVLTVVFFVLLVLAGHLGSWFVIFPVDTGTRLFGYPAHYALALIVSWPGILLLVALYAYFANRLDSEIDPSGKSDAKTIKTQED